MNAEPKSSVIKGYDAVSLKVGLDNFYKPRLPTDVDLIKIVRDALISMGLQDKVLEAYDTHPYIIEAADKTPVVQRFNLNRYWLCQLVTLHNVDTMEARRHLLPSGSDDVWQHVFLEKILVFVVTHGLPVKLT